MTESERKTAPDGFLLSICQRQADEVDPLLRPSITDRVGLIDNQNKGYQGMAVQLTD